jgi:hypothetical protein
MAEQNKVLEKISKRLGETYKWYVQKRNGGTYRENRTIG